MGRREKKNKGGEVKLKKIVRKMRNKKEECLWGERGDRHKKKTKKVE